jgi:peptidoglycan/LPS O-acetylase OafA/YrhL
MIVQGTYHGALEYLRLPVTICLCLWPLGLLMLASEKYASQLTHGPLAFLWHLLARIGLCSYSLYLLHVPLQSLRFSLNRILPHSTVFSGILFVLWFGLVLVIAWCSYRWIEIPASRWGHRLLARYWPMSPERRCV